MKCWNCGAEDVHPRTHEHEQRFPDRRGDYRCTFCGAVGDREDFDGNVHDN